MDDSERRAVFSLLMGFLPLSDSVFIKCNIQLSASHPTVDVSNSLLKCFQAQVLSEELKSIYFFVVNVPIQLRHLIERERRGDVC